MHESVTGDVVEIPITMQSIVEASNPDVVIQSCEDADDISWQREELSTMWP